MIDHKLHLYCPKGFCYYPAMNHVWCFLNGKDVTQAVVQLFAAFYSTDDFEGTNLPKLSSEGALVIEGCESYAIEDFAGNVEQVVGMETICHDEENLPC